MAARPPVRIALNVAIDGGPGGVGGSARARGSRSVRRLAASAVAAGGRCGDAAAGRIAVQAAMAILAICRDRRPARGGLVQRGRRRLAHLRARADRHGIRQPRLPGRVCADAAGAARRASGRLSPLAPSARRHAPQRLRPRHSIGAGGRRHRGHRPVPARAGLGPAAAPAGRGVAGGRRAPDRTAHPRLPVPRLDRGCRRGAGTSGGRGQAAGHDGGDHARPCRPIAHRPGGAGRGAWHAHPPRAATDVAGCRRGAGSRARAGTAPDGDRGPAEPPAGAARPRRHGAADPGAAGHRHRRRRHDRQRTGAAGRRAWAGAADPARQRRIRAVADRPGTGRAPSARPARSRCWPTSATRRGSAPCSSSGGRNWCSTPRR